MAAVLVYSEKDNLASELVSAARVAGGDVYALSINDDNLASAVSSLGVTVYSVKNEGVALADTYAVAQLVKQAAEKAGADVVLLASNRRGKELSGRLAQMLDAGCLTDAGKLADQDGKLVVSRNALGGATVAEQAIITPKKVITISAKSFTPAEAADGGAIEEVAFASEPKVKLLETREKSVESVDITAADSLVAVGQGFDDQSQVEIAAEIAKAIGAEIACSKPVATDKKWLSEERIVGISGSICKPDLAILLGISGQVQFSVGIRDAKTIVAVNSDESAPICEMADYYLVGDLSDVLPEMKMNLS